MEHALNFPYRKGHFRGVWPIENHYTA